MTWHVRIINILSNSGLFFALPYAGSALDGAPDLDIALFVGFMGLILSASREGFDYVRQEERKRRKQPS